VSWIHAAVIFILRLYWAQALAGQDDDSELKALFTPVAEQLTSSEATIVDELNSVQGNPVEMNGYYRPDAATVSQVMRPSATFNVVIDSLN